MSTPVPQHCPSPMELDDLELLADGALLPLNGFNQPGSAILLELPPEVDAAARSAGAVQLVDPEGLPLALVAWPSGAVQPLTHAQYGPFRDLMLAPAIYRERYAGRTVVPVGDALTTAELASLGRLGPLTLLALVGTGTPALSPVALVRATRAAAALLPDAVVVSVALASHGDPDVDHALGLQVVANFAADDPVHALPAPPMVKVQGSPVVEVRGAPATSLETIQPLDAYPPAIAAIVAEDQPPPGQQGLVLFFTGLSGSGKSTLARAFVDRLLEHGGRTVTSLDGDVVRRNLSAGLGFSREDRETNIRRIGWVAAEIARHGGVAVVSPIAPFDETRQQVRAMVEDAGGAFFLVHVATPLQECERRDRKGLYAQARAGEIPEFTGVSSPYEEPQDANVRVDTTGRTIDDALHDVMVGLRDEGYIDLVGPTSPVVEVPASPVVEVRGAPATSLETSGSGAPTGPWRVLFVCTANICRSPSLELLARRALPDGDDVVFSSAGTHATDGQSIDPEMLAALPAGIDASELRSRRLTRQLLEDSDLVLTAEVAHRTFILDEHPATFRKVFTLGQFAEAVGHAPAGLSRDELVHWLGENRGVADPAVDVPDPYRQGPEAAAECVARLEEMLRTVLPAVVPGRALC